LKLLLDTQVVLWWLDDDLRLGQRARALISETDAVLVSMATLWEVSVKHRIGKLAVRARDIYSRLNADDFELLPIAPEHFDLVETFRDAPHGDPFDHLIVAQAMVAKASLMTSDAQLRHYDVRCIATR
jgi:PIN domain nuclease of toxin-antitoxin system